jgi:biopolymer transport protein ExbD
MKNILCIAAIVFAVACKDKGKNEQAPPTTPSPTTSDKPTPPPTTPPTPTTPDPAAKCVVKIDAKVGSVAWDAGADGKGAMAIDGDKPGSIDNAPMPGLEDGLKGLAAKNCSGEILAADDVSYQRMVTVMDTVLKAGIKDIALTAGNDKVSPPGPATGGPADVKSSPVVVITKTDVQLNGTLVAKNDAGDLDAKLTDALSKAKTDKPGPHAILQADEATTMALVKRVILAARAAGYDDLLFAVKNK